MKQVKLIGSVLSLLALGVLLPGAAVQSQSINVQTDKARVSIKAVAGNAGAGNADGSSQSSTVAGGGTIDVQVQRSDDVENDATDAAVERPRSDAWRGWRERGDGIRGNGNRGNNRVVIGDNADLPANETSDSVVAIAGNANIAGDVREAVVAIMGNTRVEGNVGESVVTVLGNSYINSTVRDDVVTILGNVELGPQAVIQGELVTLGGTVKRDPSAVVGRLQSFSGMPVNMEFGWFKTWVKECVLYGRLLAFQPGMTWAWGVALVSLLLYVLTAALVPHTVAHCIRTLETWPGRSLLAALLSMPLIPILLLLLVITVIGILAIPFVGIALLSAGWFGKLIMLAWIGKRLLQTFNAHSETPVNWTVATLLGGMVVTLLYTIPVIGMLSYKLLQFIGFGAVLYTLLLMFQKPAPTDFAGASSGAGAIPSTPAFAADAMHAAPGEAGAAGAGSEAEAAASVAPVAAHGLPRASFMARMGALAIDAILMAIFAKHFLLALALYGAVMWKFKGTTIGGIVFHLQVVRSDGRELDWSTSIVRALSCFLSLAALGLGFIWIAFDRERQAWHDKIAGTVVVQTPKGQSLV